MTSTKAVKYVNKTKISSPIISLGMAKNQKGYEEEYFTSD